VNFIKNIKTFLILLCAVFIGMQIVCAAGMFQNSLIRADFSQTTPNVLNVKLYTSKPYKEPIKALLKDDPEYSILLPETSSNPNLKPSLKYVTKNVQWIDITTQQYTDQLKGYTKIKIKTTDPVEIIVQTEVYDAQKILKEAKEKELLAKLAAAKALEAQKKSVIMPKKEIYKPAVKNYVAQKTYAPQKAYAPVKKAVQQDVPIKKKMTAPPVSQKTVVPAVVKQTKVNTVQPIQKQVSAQPKVKTETVSKKVAAPAKIAPKPTTAKVTHPVQKQTVKQQKVTPIPVKKEVTKKTEIPKTQATKTKAAKALPKPVEGPGEEQPYAQRVGDKPNTASTKKSTQTEEPIEKSIYNPPVKKVASPSQTAVKRVTPPPAQEIGKFEIYKNQIKYLVLNNQPVVYAIVIISVLLLLLVLMQITQKLKGQKKTPEGKFKKATVDETEQTVAAEEDFPTFLNKSEQKPEEEILIPEQFDEDFLEELTREPLSESEVPDEEIISAPQAEIEEEPQEEEIISAPQAKTEEEPKAEPEDEFSSLNELNEILAEETYEDISLEELLNEDEELAEIEEEFETQPYIETEEEPTIVEDLSEIEQEIEEIVKSEFVIDENKGFYLVDYEDTSALVGHIENEIFVLKKFREKIDAKLQARVNETKQNSLSYMTKVGDFKAVIEVTPDNMKLLIEL